VFVTVQNRGKSPLAPAVKASVSAVELFFKRLALHHSSSSSCVTVSAEEENRSVRILSCGCPPRPAHAGRRPHQLKNSLATAAS
jgi:hypothetical protein